ncbi:MAG TPA: GNAT family N-acetyltransferase [Chloroflexota bacterium]|nr:GNAT family N-acetyltransferase [Chloroflexota bacterium]
MGDGPRALRPDEWDQLNALVSTVFRPSMFQDYPQLFNEPNRENLRVVADDGKVVCHVGMTERAASLLGCRIDVCCIGAVSTLDDYRGKGYASQAFQDACEKAAGDRVDVMLISGGRGLYTRVGCRQVGQDLDFSLDVAAAGRLASARPPGGGGFSVRRASVGDIPALSRLYAAEGVRFIRQREDWEMALGCGVVMNTPSDFWGVWLGDVLVAYLVIHQPDQARGRKLGEPVVVRVVEFAGQRAPVQAALPELLRQYGAARINVHVQGSDPVLGQVLSKASVTPGTPSGSSGTIRILNFVQLMERCRPLLIERIGLERANGLTFHADGAPGAAAGGFAIRRGRAEVQVRDLSSLARFLFGSHQPVTDRDVEPDGDADLLADLRGALPLPSLWYGLSYV